MSFFLLLSLLQNFDDILDTLLSHLQFFFLNMNKVLNDNITIF